MFIFKAALLLVSLTCISCNVNEDSIKLTLYFEGLCPGCHIVINDMLYPNIDKFTDYINLDLVPLGHSSHKLVDGKIEWKCEHGPTECYVNKVNACFINLNKTQTETVDLLHCFLKGFPSSESDAKKIASECAQKQNVSWDTIEHCLENDADNLEIAYEKRQNSLEIYPTYVPDLRINGVFNQTLTVDLAQDFVTVMCGILHQKPKVCSK